MNTARQFLASPIQTGMLTPASMSLARAMVAATDIGRRKSIVEFGPGTGVVTEAIEKSRKPDSTFFSIELNQKFAAVTRNRCPNVAVYEDNAANLAKYLTQHKLDKCDAIISSLPWSLINEDDQLKLLNAIHDNLDNGGVFVTYMYLGTGINPAARRFRKLLRTTFKNQNKKTLIWNNLPPAHVYTCTNINNSPVVTPCLSARPKSTDGKKVA